MKQKSVRLFLKRYLGILPQLLACAGNRSKAQPPHVLFFHLGSWFRRVELVQLLSSTPPMSVPLTCFVAPFLYKVAASPKKQCFANVIATLLVSLSVKKHSDSMRTCSTGSTGLGLNVDPETPIAIEIDCTTEGCGSSPGGITIGGIGLGEGIVDTRNGGIVGPKGGGDITVRLKVMAHSANEASGVSAVLEKR